MAADLVIATIDEKFSIEDYKVMMWNALGSRFCGYDEECAELRPSEEQKSLAHHHADQANRIEIGALNPWDDNVLVVDLIMDAIGESFPIIDDRFIQRVVKSYTEGAMYLRLTPEADVIKWLRANMGKAIVYWAD